MGHLRTGDDALRRPRGIALDSQGTLLVQVGGKEPGLV